MGGKTSTTNSSVAIPPSVLAQYNTVTSQADQTATTPFQDYTGAFVAPVNSEQSAGISATNTAADSYQPYYSAATGTLGQTQANTTGVNEAATGLAAAGAGAVNATPLTGSQINSYMSPYLNDVLGSTEALQNQSNQQQQAGQLGDAITSGAFGSDRTGIAAANLEEQQNLANNSTIANIANTAYTNAQGVAQQQQGVNLSAEQANRTALETAGTNLAGIGSTAYGEGANTASELGALGTGAQTAGLAGANAQIAAGTVQQQTQQAQDTAEYNQFQQQQSYPFQVGSWLAGISEGIGTNEGSTTTTTQPGGFFSDERLKHSIQKIGKTYDGQTIYSYKMGDDPRTRIGLIAQEVEKKHPGAVGLAAGFKMVDYGKATQPAANRGHFYSGGVVPFRRVARAYGGATDMDAVLQAQQQMYSGLGGAQTQRQMPVQNSGGHGLAVSNAPAAAPHTGMQDVSQGLGLAQKGQQLYKSVSTPSPGSGAAPPAQAPGVQSSGAVTSADPSAMATQTSQPLADGAWQAPAAAGDTAATGATDAAASGATDAAAGAATDAAAGAAGDAAAGAATGAAAGAGADAAADAAAALAAEYAAADVGTVALMAAKRGGRIHRDVGGGMPYSEDNVAYDIPDESMSGSSLKAAPAAGKQPTGLQTMLYMGDPNNTSSLMGSMFSNEALARGGVAGRGRFAEGGAPDDAPEPGPDDMPDGGLADAALAAAPSSSNGLAPASADPDSDGILAKAGKWFDKNKGTVLPILQGLAAMGTAKTVHPGVALAAGLGAGANSYLDDQTALSKQAQTQALTQGQQLENQRTAMGNQAAAKWLNQTPERTSTGPAPIPAATTASPAVNSGQSAPAAVTAAQNLDSYYRNKYYVPPITPDEAANMQQAAGASIALKSDVPTQQAQRTIDQRVARDSSANQNAAQQEADQLYPAAAAGDKVALAKYNALFQWTGDKPTDHNGNLFNSRTAQPMIGTQAQTLNQSQRSANLSAARELVNVPQSDGSLIQQEAWVAHHASSPEAYAASLNPGTQGAQPATPRLQPVPAPPAMGSVPAAAASGTAPTASRTADPYLDKALADQSFNAPIAPVIPGTSQSPIALARQKASLDSATQLKKDSDDAVSGASSAMQYLKAAKSIMDTKGATLGAYGGLVSQASRFLPFGNTDATNYQEIAKYLGNAAVQAGRANFPNATQSEVGLQLGELSPNVKMTDDAVNNLLATNLRSSRYTLDSANRAKAYLDANKDPQNFEKWNQAYYPRDKLVNAQASATGKNGQKIYFVNGKWTQ